MALKGVTMTIYVDKNEAEELVDRWIRGADHDMVINNRVFVLEKMVRKLLKEVEELRAFNRSKMKSRLL